jgi:hypothetical protein
MGVSRMKGEMENREWVKGEKNERAATQFGQLNFKAVGIKRSGR